MLFSSHEFLFLFLPATLFIYFVLLRRTRTLQNIFLTLASLFFYAWGEPAFVMVMILSIFFNWGLALLVDKFRKERIKVKMILFLMIFINLSILGLFKYLSFTLDTVNDLFSSQIGVPQIMLPLGISFFTFQAISYVVDVYREHGEVQRNPLNVALYIAFFPQLIAGPIVRYETICEQIRNRRESMNDFSAGCTRFIIGLAKKMIIANNMAIVADAAFGSQTGLSTSMAWVGALAYTFQIYFDFSAYSDMAIGLGRMFGFKFLENFNYPYISRSITEFWRRWHISLGTWFRDYVYIPLGGNRVHSQSRLVFNIFVVWLLTGIWHGANWTFIVWGLLYFVLLMLEKLTQLDKRLSYASYLTTFFFVMIGWVVFRAPNIQEAGNYIAIMFGYNQDNVQASMAPFYLRNYLGVFVCAIAFSFPLIPFLQRKFGGCKIYNFAYGVSLIIIMLMALSCVFKGGHNPFIYSNF